MSLVPFDELQELTDRKKPGEVIDWLQSHGWRFTVSAAGRPKVDRREWDRHMLVGVSEPARIGPDLEWFRGTQAKA